MREVVRFSIILLLICLVSAGLLALIFDITEPRIIQQRQAEERRAIQEVLPQAPAVIEKVEAEGLTFYKAKDAEDRLIAYVFIASAYGYSSDIRTVVSLDPQGNIIEAQILEQKETPGIGSRVEEEEFLQQFKNKNFNQHFDTISGATISSSAVIESIRQTALEVLEYEK